MSESFRPAKTIGFQKIFFEALRKLINFFFSGKIFFESFRKFFKSLFFALLVKRSSCEVFFFLLSVRIALLFFLFLETSDSVFWFFAPGKSAIINQLSIFRIRKLPDRFSKYPRHITKKKFRKIIPSCVGFISTCRVLILSSLSFFFSPLSYKSYHLKKKKIIFSHVRYM